MSSTDKLSDVVVPRKEDATPEKEKGQNDAKSETSPQKRSASELNSSDEVKQKIQKTDHKNKEENGDSEEKYDEEGDDDDDDVVPDDYDEGEDGEGDEGEDGADEEEDDDDEA